MKFTELIYSKAEAILKDRRSQAEQLAAVRRREFIEKYPGLTEIEEQMRKTALEAIRSVGVGGTGVDISLVSKSNLEAQARKKELLKSAGYPEDYLEIPYTCKDCNDTGIFNGKLCHCHIALLQQLSVGELSCSPMLARSTFDTFELKYYSDIKDRALGYSPRDIMRGCYEMLKAYAENFYPGAASFFFSGATGLGKTHLALAVLNRVTQRGYSVYYASAGSIVKQMEKEHFGRSAESIEEELEKSDLLIIDDLGAEFTTQFSVAAINELINNAVLTGKSVIIISNLSREELESKYGQRVTSRLSGFEIIQFVGEDIRQIKA